MIFAYSTHDVRVVFRAGALGDLQTSLDRLGLKRPLLVTTRAAVPDVIRELASGTDSHHDCYLAFGGGSAIGRAKAQALTSAIPIVAVPTTYSGSEMTSIWGITEGGEKRTGHDPRVAPRLVIYDPELTYDLAARVSAASGMNAIAHCVEAAWAADASPLSSLLAWDGIRRLADSLPVICDEPRDPGARADACIGAHLAGRALDMTSMGLQHKLAHVLVGSFGLPHADTHAAILPCVVAFNAAAAADALVPVADALRADDAATGLADLARQLGIRKLGELGFTRDMIPRAAQLAAQNKYPNPRPVDEAGVRTVLENALKT